MDIRASQYVVTYGPGSILETTRGSGLVLRPDIDVFRRLSIAPNDSRFVVNDARMSQLLQSLTGKRTCFMYSLPTDDVLEENDKRSSSTQYLRAFPLWRLCTRKEEHRTNNGEPGYDVLYQWGKCPVCQNYGTQIRFIEACRKGHINDIRWGKLLTHQHKSTRCTNKWFKWRSEGPLSETYIECSACGDKSLSIGHYWSLGLPYKCSNHYPEMEIPSYSATEGTCDAEPRMIQRQASNLRISELLTVFSIPPRHTEIGMMLQDSRVLDVISSMETEEFDKSNTFLRRLAKLKENGKLNENIFESLKFYSNSSWETVKESIAEVLNLKPINSIQEVLDTEFSRLKEGAEIGIPPVSSPRTGEVLFEVNPNEKHEMHLLANLDLVVQPVSKLRATVVQRGYTRYIRDNSSQPPEIVDVSFPDAADSQTWWYPGIEISGEGLFVFITGSEKKLKQDGKVFHQWKAALDSPGVYQLNLFRNKSVALELDPNFVWWHTIAHATLRAISEVSGYASASIRERIYYQGDGKLSSGGFILYTNQPGGDGSMGGLKTITKNTEEVAKRIRSQVESCSGDPICQENSFIRGKYVGAACYACLMVSETSCEHRNMWLDRNIVLENWG